jgi:heptosyltransferase-2
MTVPNTAKSFLIIQTAFIGDVILATSLAENLKSAYPEASIDFLLRKGNEGLFYGHPHIREILILDKKTHKYQNIWSIWRLIRQRKYWAVINVQRFAVSGFLTAFSGAPFRVGFSKNPFSLFFNKRVRHVLGGGLHETMRNHQLIEALVNDPVCRPALYPSIADYANVKSYKQAPYICIAPASVWYTKQFPVEGWTAFIRALAEKDVNIYLLGGNSDRKLIDDLCEQCPDSKTVNLAGQLTLLQSAALMKDAKMNYVNDSAPLHIASAVNAPVTAIFCSTVPDFGFGPLSDCAYLVETTEKLDCRPCGNHGRRSCPEGHFSCGRSIRTVQLLATLADG